MLFSGTVQENLRYSKLCHRQRAATRKWRRLQVCGAAEDGCDALVTGRDQPLGPAAAAHHRPALVRRPKIYVFDGNFSALDFKTDAKVRMALAGQRMRR